jgi:site-specific recombinase XerD
MRLATSRPPAQRTCCAYRSASAEFMAVAAEPHLQVLPAGPATIAGYLSDLALHGTKVGTMSRRLSAI